MRVGVLAWSQYATWSELMAAGTAIERAGADELWTWDHLLPIKGDASGPVFEAMLTLAGWAAETRRIRLGVMVAANTFRPPALLAKMATTLDHASGGRMTLGLGAGWFEAEHDAFGLPFGRSPGERLGWMDDAAAVIRPMLAGQAPPRVEGRDAFRIAPSPLQARLPLLIGGTGERRTLASVARHADAWNMGGDADVARRKVRVLETWCETIGRDPGDIERTLGAGPVVLRANHADGFAVVERMQARNAGWREVVPVLQPEELVDRLAPFLALGFRAFHVDLPAPFDLETVEHLVRDVRPSLRQLAGSG